LNGGATTTAGTVAELWAIPLGGGEPRLAVRYVNATTPSTNTGDNVLARQFSPDGRRLVLSAATSRAAGGERIGMFLIDLETGRVTALAAEDGAEHERPAWSPDGRRIAYVKRPIIGNTGTFDEGIWVVNVDGSGARKVPLAPAPAQSEFPAQTFLYSWTPDGRLAWFYLSLENALMLTDVDSGTHTRVRSGVGDARGLSFRSAVPRIAGSFSDRPGNCPGHFVAVLDGAPERILVRAPERPQCPLRIHDVRWDPGRDEVLYVLEIAPKGELHIRDLSGADQRIASQTEPVLAEWSPTGTHVLYINRISQQQLAIPLRGDELRYVRRNGNDDRSIFLPRAVASLSDLAARVYP
jgi:dipeptidyl aminopeptidase/acylaminoacyl peptidase